MLDAKFVFILMSVSQVKGDCFKGKCEKISFNEHQDAKQDKELSGHVFHNSVTSNPAQCYLWCINDCRCLSINYKVKNNTKYCELNRGSHFTNIKSLKNTHGSVYHLLRREYSSKALNHIVPCAGDVNCGNGCCRNNPCLNGGTCIEICEPTNVRYNCSCPELFVGKHCENRLRSCQDYKAAGYKSSGLYTVTDVTNQAFQVFCDFNSEPGFAWNLIESFELSKKDPFMKNVFYVDYLASSGDTPNWQAYLIERPYLLRLRGESTHWRATCRYNTDGTVYTDYLRASLEDFDIIREVPTVTHACRPYEYVNIRGNECVNCSAATWYKKGKFHLHIDSSYERGCKFNGNITNRAKTSEDNFGFYNVVNNKFRCTSSPNATTQFWIGSTL